MAVALWQRIRPMLAQPMEKAFDNKDWLWQLKFDGTRCLAHISKKERKVRLYNRRFSEFHSRYPELWDLYDRVNAADAILDGELVILKNGRPSFPLLQQREHIINKFLIDVRSKLFPATYFVFDLLYLNGTDLTRKPLEERQKILKKILRESEHVVLTDSISEHGKAFFKGARKQGWEGVMAKHRRSPYLLGKRSDLWIKVKANKTADVVVCGYTKGYQKRASTFGALMCGLYEKGKLRYVGRVGTGFTEQDLRNYMEMMKPFKTKRCPFPEMPSFPGEVASWLKPVLVCEVQYLEWTKHHDFRAPSFKGWRLDKPAKECVIEF